MSEELRRLQDEASLWRALTDSQGWRQLKEVMEAQRNTRIGMVGGQPIRSMADVFPQEFMKGEAAGIGLVLQLPYVQMEVLADQIKVLEFQLTQEKQDEAQNAKANASESRVELSGDNASSGWHGQ